jgi:hypothetical protein
MNEVISYLLKSYQPVIEEMDLMQVQSFILWPLKCLNELKRFFLLFVDAARNCFSRQRQLSQK